MNVHDRNDALKILDTLKEFRELPDREVDGMIRRLEVLVATSEVSA